MYRLSTSIAHACLAGVLLLAPSMAPSPARASDDDLAKTEKANALREAARLQAKSSLYRPKTLDGYIADDNQALDYLILSQQISRLAAAVRLLGHSAATAVPLMPVTPPIAAAGAPAAVSTERMDRVSAIYGPDGPTVKSVTLLLEYRLMVAGNPRLKVGAVTAKDDSVLATVVTVDGSLVEQFTVDKKTGAWTTIR